MALSYPPARRLDLTEDIHGHQVSDPYRWLEDPATPDSHAWLTAEETCWHGYRDTLEPTPERFAARVAELTHVGAISVPVWRAERRFFIRRDPGQDHGVLYVAEGDAPERVLIDPVALDPTGRTTLDSWQPDKEGRLLAYQVSVGGNEESVLYVLDVATGAHVDGPIDRCRYSPVAWLPGGKAFYFTRRLDPALVPGEEQYHRRVYLHTIGTDPAQDALIFGEGRDKTAFYGMSVSRDGRWLVLSESLGTAPRNDVWIADLTVGDPAAPGLAVVIAGADAQTSAHVARDGRLYVHTDLDAPRGRLCVADPAAPGPDQWRDLIGSDPEAVLQGYTLLDDALLVSWTRHAIGWVTTHSPENGERTGEIELPGLGTVGGLTSHPEGGDEAWLGYTDYGHPSTVLRYYAGDVSVWATAPGNVDLPPLHAEQVTYLSADGTPVRMIVMSSPGSVEPRPAILNGYGGFDISLTPGYSANILAWVEAGGVYAVAGLRGGGEEGQEWHRAGRRDKKRNVFDDFHAAAEWLIESRITTREQLAIWGGSNGGLLMGAAVTQRPDLYAAAIISAPLLDMVRYERFGLGQLWNDEYGTASDPVELGWLLGYSPYHHVTDGVAYPAVLFTVFTSDSRVDPIHAYKMCAALQHATASDRPVLLRAEAEVGHGARAVRFAAALAGDALAFVARQTGLASPA